MIIYNVTIKIAVDSAEDWVAWMKETHIPDVMNTGKFTGHKFVHLFEQDDHEGITYAVQYFAPDLKTFRKYEAEDADRLRQDALERFKDRFVAFRTLMQEI